MGMNVETVHLYGFPGATTRALMYRIPELFNNNTVSSPSPIAACIQIGGNDLASFDVTPPMVFQDIMDLVLLLIDTYNIKQVNPKKAGSFDPISLDSTPPSDLGRGAAKNYVIWHIRKPCRDEQSREISIPKIKAVFKLCKFMLILCICLYF